MRETSCLPLVIKYSGSGLEVRALIGELTVRMFIIHTFIYVLRGIETSLSPFDWKVQVGLKGPIDD